MPDEQETKVDLDGIICIQGLPLCPSKAESLTAEDDCLNQDSKSKENLDESKFIEKGEI